jgi:hypothetical protein
VVPYDELRAHEQSCVHATCAVALKCIEATLRAELQETEERLRKEYQRAAVEEHVMTQFRECARYPPGPGFRVELVKPDADISATFGGTSDAAHDRLGRLPDSRSAQGYHNRLLCLVPGVEGTIHEGGCYPVLLTYSTRSSASSSSTSFRMCAPVARLPPFEGPEMQTRYTYVPAGWKRTSGSPLAWGLAQPSTEELATQDRRTQRGDTPDGWYLASSFCHPNVYPSGKISLSTLDENHSWHPSMTAAEILLSIQAFLNLPNFLDPAQEETYLMGKCDLAAYEQRVREQAARYTAVQFESLVRAYCRPPIRSRLPDQNGAFLSTEPEWTADGRHRVIVGMGG